MNFAQFISMLSFTTPFFCSAKAGWDSNRWIGSGFGLLIGSIIGLFSFYSIVYVLKKIRSHPELSQQNPKDGWLLFSVFLCFALAAVVFMFSFLSMWTTEHGISLLRA